MATTVAAPAYAPAKHEAETGLWSWLTTVDHKRIGTLYLFTSLFLFVWGGIEAALIRAQLAGPNLNVLSADTYNQVFTMHGTTMVFLAIMPGIPAASVFAALLVWRLFYLILPLVLSLPVVLLFERSRLAALSRQPPG